MCASARDLLAPQPGGAAAPPLAEADVLGPQRLAAAAEEVGEPVAVHAIAVWDAARAAARDGLSLAAATAFRAGASTAHVAAMTSRIALITGGNRGIGRSTALHLARDGVDVILTYRTNADEAAAVVAEIEALGRRAAALQLDVGDVSAFDAFADAVREVLRGWDRDTFDFLVNNGGMSIGGTIAEVTEEDFDRARRRPLQGRLLPHPEARAAAGRQRLDRQHLDRPGPLHEPAARGLRLGQGRRRGRSRATSRRSSARAASRVNTIAPGPVATDFSGGIVRDTPAFQEHLAAITALGRIAVADDIGARDRRAARRRQPLGHRPAHRGLRRDPPVARSPSGRPSALIVAPVTVARADRSPGTDPLGDLAGRGEAGEQFVSPICPAASPIISVVIGCGSGRARGCLTRTPPAANSAARSGSATPARPCSRCRPRGPGSRSWPPWWSR